MSKRVRTAKPPRSRQGVDQPLPARQRRSENTTERLLQAAEDVLRDDGVDAATLRAIADRAGVSIGIVYRRFRDKDSVLRAVYMRFFARMGAANRRALASDALRNATTTQVITGVVRGIAEGYRRNRDLVRALVLYARTHSDPMFRKRAMKLNAGVYADIQRLLLGRRQGIRHHKPELAVAFAITAVASVLQERILFGDVTALPPLSDGELMAEAIRMLECYLSVRSTDMTKTPRIGTRERGNNNL
jgi:AcrR family transcriptional regulator